MRDKTFMIMVGIWLFIMGMMVGPLIQKAHAGVVVGQPTPNPYANGNSHYEQSKQKAHTERRLRHYAIEKSHCKRVRIASCAALHNYEDLR